MNDSQNRAAALTKNAPRSSIEAVRAVFGESPRNVLLPAKLGADTLDWVDAIFHAIEVLNEKGGGEMHIKRLSKLGRYVSNDIAEAVGCEYEEMLAKVEAAEAAEGGAA